LRRLSGSSSRRISELPETTHFGVLVFNSRTTTWQAKLVPATSENKDLACRFVALQDLGPATASYDALEAALSFDAEAIYFLTDGAPFGGKITQPAAIVTVISKLNRLRRMTVNSIGIGVGQEGKRVRRVPQGARDAEFLESTSGWISSR